MIHKQSSDIQVITHHLSKIIDTPIEESFTRLTGLIKRMFNVPIVTFSLLDEKRQQYHLINNGEFVDLIEALDSLQQSQKDDIVVIEDSLQSDLLKQINIKNYSFRFLVNYPIKEKNGKKIGSVTLLDDKTHSFNEQDIANLKDIIQLAESEIANCRLSKAQKKLLQEITVTEEIAFIDAELRTWNYQGFKKILNNQIQISLNDNAYFSVAAIDVDQYKKIEEVHGEQTCKDLLKLTAKSLLRICRAEDTIALGQNSHFILLIHTANLANTKSVIDRIYQNLSSLAVPELTLSKKTRFTVTIGFTYANHDNCNLESLVRNAEAALIKGKIAGGNRTCMI